MPSFTNDEKAKMMLILGECHGNSREAANVYMLRYPGARHPSHGTIRRVYGNLRKYGSFTKPSKHTDEYEEHRNEREVAILASVYANPHDSTRHVAQQLGISQFSVWNVLRKHSFRPFHVHLHQELGGDDYMTRVEYCMFVREKIANNPNFLQNVLFSDESTFSRDGTVNRHNLHYWAPQNPHWLREHHHQRGWKVNVWCGILDNRVIGPYFLEGTLTGDGYLAFLENVVYEDVLDDMPLDVRQNTWFQQDGAPVHSKRSVTRWLNNTFHHQWIGARGPVRWPPRSPDLTSLDFFLWPFLKEKVYETEHRNVEELKERIRNAVALITPEMLRAVRSTMENRIEACLTADGGHFEHLL